MMMHGERVDVVITTSATLARTKHKTSTRKSRAGRPAKFTSTDALQKAVDAYFNSFKRKKWPPPTLSGLSTHLDFADFSTFKDYEGNPKYSHVLKKARMRIVQAHEEQLFVKGCTGSIFWLKCHGGEMFKENPQQHEHSGPGGGPLAFDIEWGEPDDGDGSG